jgi:hypothetical protein
MRNLFTQRAYAASSVVLLSKHHACMCSNTRLLVLGLDVLGRDVLGRDVLGRNVLGRDVLGCGIVCIVVWSRYGTIKPVAAFIFCEETRKQTRLGKFVVCFILLLHALLFADISTFTIGGSKKFKKCTQKIKKKTQNRRKMHTKNLHY